MREKLKQVKGITLIALVITIIVLLILAGVSIAMLTGENGILTQANNASIQQSHGAIREGIALAYNEYQIEINTASNTKLASRETIQIQGKEEKALASYSSFLDFLVQKGYANSSTGIIDVEALTGSKQALGNGTDTDVYKIEEQDGSYVINYYDEDNQKEEIWSIINNVTEGDPSKYVVENIRTNVGGLRDVENDTFTTFSNAYVISDGKTVDVTEAIETSGSVSELNISKVESIFYQVTSDYLGAGTQNFMIIKDGKSYSGTITLTPM